MVTYQPGEQTDSRTRAMLAEAERTSGAEVIVVQGSWSDGRYSAGTHSGAGVVDLRVWHLSPAATEGLVTWLRRVGFAAWYRTIGSGPHIHAVAIGEDGLSPSAADQVDDYRDGRNGLANNGADTGPDVPFTTWERYLDEELPDTGGDGMKFIGNRKLASWFETRIARALVGNDVLASWFETRVANGTANALENSTTARQALRKIIEEETR